MSSVINKFTQVQNSHFMGKILLRLQSRKFQNIIVELQRLAEDLKVRLHFVEQ